MNRLKRMVNRKLDTVPSEDTELKRFFTDMELQQKTFQELVNAPVLAKRIFIIRGVGGAGKSSLVRMFRLFCKQQGIAVSLISGDEIKTSFDVLRGLSEGLEQDGIQLPLFTRVLKQYISIQAKTEQESKKAKGNVTAALGKATVKAVVGASFSAVPVVGPVVSAFGSEGVDALFGWLSNYLSQDEVSLYLNASKKLTDEFLKDVWKIAPERRLVLILDTYEQMLGLGEWVCEWMKGLHPNVLVVIAGRTYSDEVWDRNWPGWMVQASINEVGTMNADRMRELIQRYYAAVRDDVPNPKQVEEIVRFGRGLPLVVTTAVRLWVHYGVEDFSVVKPMVAADLVDRLMENTPKSLRSTLEAAATVRWFNKDILGALTDSSNVNESYEELRLFPFVRPRVEGLALHDVVREMMNDNLKINDPERYRLLHEKASGLYEQRLAHLEEAGHSFEERQPFVLEHIYQMFQLFENEGMEYFKQVFEDAFLNTRQFNFCEALLRELATYNLKESNRRWIKYYEGLLAIYEGNDPDLPCKIMEDLLSNPDLERKLKENVLENLAGVYWYYSLRVENGTEKAKQLYQQCLELRSSNPEDIVGQAKLLIWLGVLNQRTKGKGEEFFQRALFLCKKLGHEYDNITAWVERELSISYRMQGKFAESLPLITSSMETYERLGHNFDKAHSQINYAMLLVYKGKLREAEQQFGMCVNLFASGSKSRSYEQAWPLVGMGDVALGRSEFDDALDKYNRALEIWKDDKFGRGVAQGGLAEVYCAQQRWDLAIELADKSLNLKRELNDKFGIGWTLNTKGKALVGKEKFDTALACFQEGQAQMAEYGSWFGQSKLTLGVCQVFYATNVVVEFNKAAKNAEIWGSQNDYFDVLAHLNFLKGMLVIKEFTTSDSNLNKKKTTLNRAASSFAAALAHALQYNIYLLDSLLQDFIVKMEVINTLNSGDRHILGKFLVNYWKREAIKNQPLELIEKNSRDNEDIHGRHQKVVVEQLQIFM